MATRISPQQTLQSTVLDVVCFGEIHIGVDSRRQRRPSLRKLIGLAALTLTTALGALSMPSPASALNTPSTPSPAPATAPLEDWKCTDSFPPTYLTLCYMHHDSIPEHYTFFAGRDGLADPISVTMVIYTDIQGTIVNETYTVTPALPPKIFGAICGVAHNSVRAGILHEDFLVANVTLPCTQNPLPTGDTTTRPSQPLHENSM